MDMRPRDSGIEFLVGVGAGTGVFSMVHSSLWSAQNFGENPRAAESCNTYAWLAAAATLTVTGFGSLIERTVWPLIGGVSVSGFMLLGYRRSLRQAAGVAAPAPLMDRGPAGGRPRGRR